ncbi:MAG: hypothetical protein KAJ19_24880, partial [Gammaproteobacteria bacterium]|nr:hypothetical protein [Gammaproteobacteria bacterium]
MNISDQQIDAIVEAYKEGTYSRKDSVKVSSFMQTIYFKSQNKFVPWVVNDIHMQRAFGFLGVRPTGKYNKDGSPKTLPKPLSVTNQEYMTFMIAKLSQDLGFSPDVMQAIVWKYAKDKYGVSRKEGTWGDAFNYAQGEIEIVMGLRERDELKPFPNFSEENLPNFNEALPNVTERKAGKIVGKTRLVRTNDSDAYDTLYRIAEIRAGKISISAVPSSSYVQEATPLKIQKQYHDAVMKEITTQDGTQLLFLTALNIPHRIVEHLGSWGTLEQSFDIIFAGNNINLATVLAPLLGSGLLQESVYSHQLDYNGEDTGIALRKKNREKFTEHEIIQIFSQVNPNQDVDGFNFTEVEDGHTMLFITEDIQGLKNAFNTIELDGQFTFGEVKSNGTFTNQQDYEQKIKDFSRSPYLSGRPDLLRTAENLLHKPVQEVFNRFRKKLKSVKNPQFLDIEALVNQSPEFDTYELGEFHGDLADRTVSEIIDRIVTAPKSTQTRVDSRLSWLYTNIFDDMNPIHKLVKLAKEERDISIDKDPYILARMLRGWEGVVEHFLTFGTLDIDRKINGESFDEILKDAESMDKLNAYLVASRAIDIQRTKFPDKTLEEISGIKDSTLKRAHKILDTKENQALAQRIYAYNDKILQFVRDSGLLSQEAYENIRDQNKFYVPFYRVLEEEHENFNPKMGKGLVNVGAGIKYFKGSGKVIINPMESIVKNTYTFINLAL